MTKDVVAKVETFNVGENFSNMAVIDTNKKTFSIRFERKI